MVCSKNYVYESLRLMVKGCRELQSCCSDEFPGMPSKKWLKEFCTIRIGGGRRMGHTSSVEKVVEKEKLGQCIYICCSASQLKFADIKNPDIKCCHSLQIESMYGISNVDAIFIDTSYQILQKSCFQKQVMKNIFQCFRFAMRKTEMSTALIEKNISIVMLKKFT